MTPARFAVLGVAAVLLVVLVLVVVFLLSDHPAAACSVHYIPNWPGSPKWLQQSGQLSTVRCP